MKENKILKLYDDDSEGEDFNIFHEFSDMEVIE